MKQHSAARFSSRCCFVISALCPDSL